MPPFARGLIFLAIGSGLQAILGFAVVPALLGGSSTATLVLALIGMIGAAAYGLVTGWVHIYDLSPKSIAMYVVDVTWSSLNTVTGLGFMIWCAAKGSFAPPQERAWSRGVAHFTGAQLPGADATTIGNVMGGTWMTHELIHVQQARIFGPFYWPAYLFTYAFGMIARFITGRFRDPHWQAYERVPLEDWAYRSAPGETIEWGPWVGWFFLTLLNVLAAMVLIAPIPVVGAIPAAIGLGFVPWWIGLIVLLGYGLVRSFLAKAHEAITGFGYFK